MERGGGLCKEMGLAAEPLIALVYDDNAYVEAAGGAPA